MGKHPINFRSVRQAFSLCKTPACSSVNSAFNTAFFHQLRSTYSALWRVAAWAPAVLQLFSCARENRICGFALRDLVDRCVSSICSCYGLVLLRWVAQYIREALPVSTHRAFVVVAIDITGYVRV